MVYEEEDMDSSMIYAVQYDTESKTLMVRFQNDSLYSYDDVEEEQYFDLINAPSIGTYFARNIRWNYPYMKLEGVQPSGSLLYEDRRKRDLYFL